MNILGFAANPTFKEKPKRILTKKVLMLIGEYVQDYEAIFCLQSLQLMGIDVDVVSPGKKSGDLIPTSFHYNTSNSLEQSVSNSKSIYLNFPFEEAKEGLYLGLILPSGCTPDYLLTDLPEKSRNSISFLLKSFFAAGKPVACIGSSLLILNEAGLLKGRRVGGNNPIVKDKLKNCNCVWVEMKVDSPNSITSGNLITSANFNANVSLLKEFLHQIDRSRTISH